VYGYSGDGLSTAIIPKIAYVVYVVVFEGVIVNGIAFVVAILRDVAKVNFAC